jgi:hypothetical protein
LRGLALLMISREAISGRAVGGEAVS